MTEAISQPAAPDEQPQTAPQPEREPSLLRIVGWGAYLACSWTWCIGMFLPLLLIRDYGPLAFPVFAAPNIIGAAAFAWWFAKPGSSEAFVSRHGKMVHLFSLVTVLFHAAFLGWMAKIIPFAAESRLWFWAPAGMAAVVGGALWTSPKLRSTPTLIAMPVWLISLAVLFWLALNKASLPPSEAFGLIDLPGLAFVAPVCAFGFAFCPLLDGTFHNARQSMTERESKASFSLGFGVMFFAMILLTVLYAPVLQPMLLGFGIAAPSVAVGLVALHISNQATFTTAAHQNSRPGTGFPLWTCLTAMAVVAIGAYFIESSSFTRGAMGGGEILYRVFMGAYGLAFPAYVLFAIRRPTREPANWWKVWLVFVLIAAPAFWMGFVEGDEPWLAAGLLAVIAAALFGGLRSGRSTGSSENG